MSCGPNVPYYDLTCIFITDPSEKVNKEANSTVRRSLLGYRLEINFAECAILSPSVTSYVFQNPKAGQTYSFMLSAVTCSVDKLKERRMKVSFISIKIKSRFCFRILQFWLVVWLVIKG